MLNERRRASVNLLVLFIALFSSSLAFAGEDKNIKCDEKKAIAVAKENKVINEYCSTKAKHECEFKSRDTSIEHKDIWTVIADPIYLDSKGNKGFSLHEERFIKITKDCVVLEISGYHHQYYP